MSNNVENYMKDLAKSIRAVLTENQRRKYCVIFGPRVLGEFDSLEEAIKCKKSHSCLVTMLYMPLDE